VLGEINERAYGQSGTFVPLVRRIADARARFHGLRDGERFVCVALTMRVGDDLSIQYVATEESHRRRGLAAGLLITLLADAKAAGMRTATLQASAAGLAIYKRLGFRRVALLRGYVRPA
jgi:predicted GNAT family acetyltransferase